MAAHGIMVSWYHILNTHPKKISLPILIIINNIIILLLIYIRVKFGYLRGVFKNYDTMIP